MPFFDHLSANVQRNRFLMTSLVSFKIFLGAFLWEGLGLGCNCSIHSASFYFYTGFGAGLGTFLGQLLPALVIHRGHQKPIMLESLRVFILGFSVFLGPGTLWQRLVNDAADWGWSFTGGFFYMWLISGLVFVLSYTVFSALLEAIITRKRLSVVDARKKFFMDCLLGISVGLGDAFFMGTSASQFSDNWLAPGFGVYDSTPPLQSMLLAGISTVIGFTIAQVFQNIIFPITWADPTNEEDSERNLVDVENGNEINKIGNQSATTNNPVLDPK